MSYGVKLPQAKGSFSSAQTATQLVAGVAGAQIKVAGVYTRSAASGTISLLSENDATPRWQDIGTGANGVAADGQFLFVCDAGDDLDVTSDIAADHFVSVLYTIA